MAKAKKKAKKKVSKKKVVKRATGGSRKKAPKKSPKKKAAKRKPKPLGSQDIEETEQQVGTGGYDGAGEELPSTEDIVNGDVVTDFEIDDGTDEKSGSDFPSDTDDEQDGYF